MNRKKSAYIKTAFHHDGDVVLATGEFSLGNHDHVADTSTCPSLFRH